MAKSTILESMPARLLAVFLMDTNETELTIPFGNWSAPAFDLPLNPHGRTNGS